MADKWAVATGNWSDTATWNSGTLPQAGDDVFADGKTVTIDQSINVGSLRTTQRSGGTAGGGFSVSTGGFTITLTDGLWLGTTTVLTVSGAATGTTVFSDGAPPASAGGASAFSRRSPGAASPSPQAPAC